jgi:hypothetical protein
MAQSASKMRAIDVAWLAGFFDGEGTIGTYRGGRGGKHLSLFISIPNTHKPSLRRCQAVTGCGTVIPQKTKRGYKQQWRWRVTRRMNVLSIAKQMLPHLTTKKQVVTKILGDWLPVVA